MPAAKKDWFWTLTHSLWLGWLFTLGTLHWVAFLHAGVRTGRKRWIAFAVFYAMPLVAVCMLPNHPEGAPYTLIENGTYTWYVLSAIVSFVHGFAIRKEYMLRVQARDRRDDEKLVNRIESEYGVELEARSTVAYTVQTLSGPLDVNHATEDELAALPGVGVMGAEMAVAVRRRNGYFQSVESFGAAIGLKAAQIEALRPLVRFGPSTTQPAEQAEAEAPRQARPQPRNEA